MFAVIPVNAGIKYIDKGDVDTPDFETGAFTENSDWHELDLSGKITKGAVLVLARLVATPSVANKKLQFRTAGVSTDYNISDLRGQVIDVSVSENMLVAPNKDGVIEYIRKLDEWSFIELTIRGCWV